MFLWGSLAVAVVVGQWKRSKGGHDSQKGTVTYTTPSRYLDAPPPVTELWQLSVLLKRGLYPISFRGREDPGCKEA